MSVNLTGLVGTSYNAVHNRIPVSEDNTYGILTYGLDNLYPQQVDQLRLASPLIKSSTEVLEDFLNGSGWASNPDKVVNRFGETTNDILNKVAKDAAKFSGAFAVHVNLNARGQGLEMQHIPFMYVRMHIPKRSDGRVTNVAVSDNWEQSSTKRDLKPISYAILNPDTAASDTLRGGKGQVLYFTGVENGVYPTATFDSILNTAVADEAIQQYERNTVTNGFHGANIVHYPAAIDTPEQERKVKEKVEKLVGTDSPGVLVMTVDAENDKPLVETIEATDSADMFLNTLTSVRDRVLQVYQQPAALLGVNNQSSVFSQSTFFESYTVYNVITRNKRKAIARALGKATDLMGFKVGDILENDLGVIPNFGEPNAITNG